MDIRKGERIKLRGANLFGTVTAISGDGTLSIALDNGATMQTPPDTVTPVAEHASAETHDPVTGQFRKGHRPMASSTRKKNRMKYCRETILQQLEPFIEDLGTLIEQIDEPSEKILAMSRILPYTMPKLSTIEVKDKEPRNLSAEERIAKLNAAFHGKPDPTEEEGEDAE